MICLCENKSKLITLFFMSYKFIYRVSLKGLEGHLSFKLSFLKKAFKVTEKKSYWFL